MKTYYSSGEWVWKHGAVMVIFPLSFRNCFPNILGRARSITTMQTLSLMKGFETSRI